MSEQDETSELHHHTQVDQHRAVSEDEIIAAMSINSIPDEVRTGSANQDETEQVVDGEGNLRAHVGDLDPAPGGRS